ncbi:DegT/DnrJ/EryC1/StrS family aminotransferase [Butyrivibrio sp. VCB2006]|uniref:DegT/DnrJ/EryC1/StrS family aminotransferase n=1 Tax=Butyrivibrio sp. VCB2006 TaxID=1280679 RepID=UPI0004196EDA|nr:DegT/DnrJ/EryC1/StrS family aminotransferase [Butyrivibrio sp. VCB2006]
MKKDIYVTRSSMPTYEEYCEAIKPLWESRWLTNMGQYHQELEQKLKEYLEVPEVSLTVNGHMALELAIQSFGFSEGSEVITTPFTFISTTHAIVRNRLQPVFCDVKESDGTIDETKIEELITPKTVAILPVHVYGHICNVEAIQQIADKYGLKVIYDAAHAFGEKYNGVGVANFGDASIFSFHATKVFNTIEGGAVCSKNHEIYEKLYNLKNFGIRGEELVASVGANAKMNEFCAIMGLLNLKHLSESITDRKRVHEEYCGALTGVNGIKVFDMEDCSITRNYAYFPILIDENYSLSRDELYNKLAENGIHVRKYFYPATADQACFKNLYKNVELNYARELVKKVLVLPIYEGMSQEDISRVIDTIIQ